MMPRLAALLLLLVFGHAQAALNTDGLPAGAVGIVGFDLTAFRASKAGQAIEQLANLKSKDLEASRKLHDQLGIDAKKDLRDLVVAVYPGPDGKVAEKTASAVVLIRGKFSPATIDDFGAKHGVAAKTVGKHRAWEAGPFIEKVTGEKPKDNAQGAYLVAHSADLVLVASEAILERALAAADRAEKTGQLPAAVAAKFASAPQGWLYLYADATKMPNAKEETGAEDIALTLGEEGADLRLAVAAGFVSAEKASTMRKQIKGLQAFAMIGLANDDGKSPEEKEDMALLAELVQKIRVGGEGKQATLDLDFPAEKLVQAVAKAIAKAQKGPAVPAAK
jgi:hypothetical protein